MGDGEISRGGGKFQFLRPVSWRALPVSAVGKVGLAVETQLGGEQKGFRPVSYWWSHSQAYVKPLPVCLPKFVLHFALSSGNQA